MKLKCIIVSLSSIILFAAEQKDLPSFKEWINLAQSAKLYPQKIPLQLETKDQKIISLPISDPLLINFPLLEDLGLKGEKAGLGCILEPVIKVPFTVHEIHDLKLISKNDLLKSFTENAILHAEKYNQERLNHLMEGIYYFGLPIFSKLESELRCKLDQFTLCKLRLDLDPGVYDNKITYADIIEFKYKYKKFEQDKTFFILKMLYWTHQLNLLIYVSKSGNEARIKSNDCTFLLIPNIIEFLTGLSIEKAEELSLTNKLSNLENKIIKYGLKQRKDAKLFSDSLKKESDEKIKRYDADAFA